MTRECRSRTTTTSTGPKTCNKREIHRHSAVEDSVAFLYPEAHLLSVVVVELEEDSKDSYQQLDWEEPEGRQ